MAITKTSASNGYLFDAVIVLKKEKKCKFHFKLSMKQKAYNLELYNFLHYLNSENLTKMFQLDSTTQHLH